MARKTQEIKDKLEEAKLKLLELENLEKAAKEEEELRFKECHDKITAIASEYNMTCGIRLYNQDIVAIISLALETKESIEIPFNLYINE